MFKNAGRVLSLFLVAAMMCALLPTTALAAKASDFSDMPVEDHWSYDALADAVANGLLNGSGGKIMPMESLTRAQMAAIMNRAFGMEEASSLAGFSDVPAGAWYASDMAKAVKMKTFLGDGTGHLRPEDTITRQEAFTVLARAFKLPDGDTLALNKFSDKSDIAPWAVKPLAALAEAGYIRGDGDRLRPTDSISREEFAQLMYNAVGGYISAPGTYSEAIDGNIVINAPGVTLKGLTITGDLILGDGVGNGDVTLDNVTVTGRLVVRGGGENSIRIINKSNVGSISIGKTGSGGIRVMSEEGCRVDMVYVDDGSDDIILEGVFNNVSVDTYTPVVLKDASVTALTVSAASASVRLDGGSSVTVAQITGSAAGAAVEVGTGSRIAKIESAAEAVSIRGGGTVVEAIISGNNAAVDTRGTDIKVLEGTKGVTSNGKDVTGGTAPDIGGGSTSYSAEAATYTQLVTALSDGSVTSITITGNIIIPDGITVTLNKPVAVDKRQGALFTVSGTLINESTLTCEQKINIDGPETDTVISINGGVFENRQTFINNGRFGGSGCLNNTGTVILNDWFHCFAFEIENSGIFNIEGGTLTLSPIDADGTVFTNTETGVITTSGASVIEIGFNCALVNAGTVTVGTDGCIDNFGAITNTGVFDNAGFILDAGTIDGTAITGGGTIRRVLTVTTAAQLATVHELDIGDRAGIIIMGDITLENVVLINKPAELHREATLTVPDGTWLSVKESDSDETELMIKGKLHIQSGGKLSTIGIYKDAGRWGQVTVNGGELKADAGSIIENNGSILLIRGAIDISEEAIYTGDQWNDVLSEMDAGSFDELKAALEEGRCQRINLTENVTLTGNITLNKDLVIGEDFALTVPDGKNLTVAGGGSVKNNGTLSVSKGGTVINKGFIHTGGAAGILDNKGNFTNWERGEWSESGVLEIMDGGTINNTGTFVNNGPMNVNGGILENTAGRFTTNNTGGLFFSEGAEINSPAEFHNAGYMKITDEYGDVDTTDSVEIVDFSGLTNDSIWIDYSASVYSGTGLAAAIEAQEEKIEDLGNGEKITGLEVYNRLDFAKSMGLEGSQTLNGFTSYWVMNWWDGEAMEDKPVILTVPTGDTLTLAEGNTLFVSSGEIENNGTVALEGGANIEIWVDGTFTNLGTVINGGRFIAQDEYAKDAGASIITHADVSGNAIPGILYSAKVYDWAGLEAAAGETAEVGSEKYYFRIEIRGDIDIALANDLAIDADVFIEWSGGIEVPEGKSLTLKGAHTLENSGDIWVYGTLITETDYTFYNFCYLQVGGGDEEIPALFENGGEFYNCNSVKVFPGGTFSTTADGIYDGDGPEVIGTET